MSLPLLLSFLLIFLCFPFANSSSFCQFSSLFLLRSVCHQQSCRDFFPSSFSVISSSSPGSSITTRSIIQSPSSHHSAVLFRRPSFSFLLSCSPVCLSNTTAFVSLCSATVPPRSSSACLTARCTSSPSPVLLRCLPSSSSSLASSTYLSARRLPYLYKVPRARPFRWTRRWRTSWLTRQSGSNHVTELTRERRKLCEQTKQPVTQGAHLLYVSGVDRRISDSDLEGFFAHFLGGPKKCVVRLSRDTNKPVGNHRGHGILFFETPSLATMCLLRFNGIRLGERNLVMAEAYRKDYLTKQRGVGGILRAAGEAVARGRTCNGFSGGGEVKEGEEVVNDERHGGEEDTETFRKIENEGEAFRRYSSSAETEQTRRGNGEGREDGNEFMDDL
eukprot:GHVS01105848.1.p1 GENE.GHVS01105848.1~~GHVS01105848.1.p1  ORF type:complete len:389 (-),score=70.99 GHVS01105848.1:79-1245(-)